MPIFLFFLPLWEKARYRLNYCLKGLIGQNSQPTVSFTVPEVYRRSWTRDKSYRLLHFFATARISSMVLLATGYKLVRRFASCPRKMASCRDCPRSNLGRNQNHDFRLEAEWQTRRKANFPQQSRQEAGDRGQSYDRSLCRKGIYAD